MTHGAGMIATNDIGELRRSVAAARSQGLRIGCVPTMGALHAGHESLIRRAKEDADFVVVTVFVNPTQFGEAADLANYPRPVEDDLQRCQQAGVDVVFLPEEAQLYSASFETWVDVERMGQILEGEYRPGHFRGVATIVLKLFNLVAPDAAYFGAKDYQQQLLIRRMVEDLNLAIEIVVCPTVREEDGLAMSSRNARLSRSERRSALALIETLRFAADQIRDGREDLTALSLAMSERLAAANGVEPDYAVIADAETLEALNHPRPRMVALVAARVGATRLIDNLEIEAAAATCQ